MIAAEDWHRYQEDYVKYGVDLRPEAPKTGKKSAEKTSLKVSAQEKAVILMLILAVGICCIAIIFLQAMASGINYKVYTLNQEIAELKGDIDNLNVTLQSQNNLSQIETYAENNLKMVYPAKDQRVAVSEIAGSAEVDAYIASLSESQKGTAVQKNVTAAAAARKLLSQA